MRSILTRRLAAATAAVLAALALPFAAEAPRAQTVAGAAAVTGQAARVIVKYREAGGLARKQAMTLSGRRILQTKDLGDRLGMTLVAGTDISDRSHVVRATGISSQALAARLAADPDIEYAVVDEKKRITAAPNDPFYATRPYNSASAPTAGGPLSGQWYLKPPDATIVSAINAEQAWDLQTGSASIVVAVLDTGLRFDHPDLQGGHILPGYDFVSADSGGVFATANDGDGRDANASDPGDWVTEAENDSGIFDNCEAVSSSWHGTLTLGLIGAATSNGVGIASVGRGNVRLLPVRVLGKCGGYDSDIQAAMRWAAGLSVGGVPANTNPARIINLSLGSTGGCNQAYSDVIAQVNAVGATVVVSAGNSTGRAVGTPANCPGALAVLGLRHAGTKVGFSDLGSQIAIAAPGGNCVNTTAGLPCLYPIMTTSNSGTTTPVVGAAGAIYTDSFDATFGTSFSAPLVSGTIALMLSTKPTLGVAEVRSILQRTARAFPPASTDLAVPQCVTPGSVDQLQCHCTTALCGAGMLDAQRAVAATGNVQASISVVTAAPVAGQPVQLTSSSIIGSGQGIVSYLWSITDAGVTGAVISGTGTEASVAVAVTAAGTFTVQLTTTDNTGYVSSATASVTVAEAPVNDGSSGGGGGGGGGAVGVFWLALLLMAIAALAVIARIEGIVDGFAGPHPGPLPQAGEGASG